MPPGPPSNLPFGTCKLRLWHEFFPFPPTILDKTTWENVFINAHYLTQQNYFQINGFA